MKKFIIVLLCMMSFSFALDCNPLKEQFSKVIEPQLTRICRTDKAQMEFMYTLNMRTEDGYETVHLLFDTESNANLVYDQYVKDHSIGCVDYEETQFEKTEDIVEFLFIHKQCD